MAATQQALPLERITVADRLRSVDEHYVEALARSLAREGLNEPIVVRPDGRPGRWRLVAGAHRLEAARSLGWPTIDAIVREDLASDDEARLVEIAENLMRRELSLLDKAIFVTAYTDVLARLYPELTKRGRIELSACFPDEINSAPRAVLWEDVADRLGLKDRTVREYREIAHGLHPDAVALLREREKAPKECPLNAGEVAARMTTILGAEVSADALYSYTAASKPDHQISLIRFVAFVRAVEAWWLWDLLVEDDGLIVMEGREARLGHRHRPERRRQQPRRRWRRVGQELPRGRLRRPGRHGRHGRAARQRRQQRRQRPHLPGHHGQRRRRRRPARQVRQGQQQQHLAGERHAPRRRAVGGAMRVAQEPFETPSTAVRAAGRGGFLRPVAEKAHRRSYLLVAEGAAAQHEGNPSRTSRLTNLGGGKEDFLSWREGQMTDTLYFGDNLDILRNRVPDESIDLVYLDPPFNSQAQYNVLFHSPKKDERSAQAGAFRDTWSWGEEAEAAFDQTMQAGGGVARFLDALRAALGTSDLMAYLAMMAIRLHELRRTLKPTGSLYLHCDPTASHYLKVILDGIFGPRNFQAEIIWRRTTGRSMAKRWPRLHDVILHYGVDASQTKFFPVKAPLDPVWLQRKYRYEDDRGRYSLADLTGAGTRNGPSGQPWKDVDPAKIGAGRHWRYVPERLDALDKAGAIYWPPRGKYPMLKHYLTEESGRVVGDLWQDIQVLGRTAAERLGYPTQKPLALLDRIIRASSEEGDLVLDPFCGCGTTVEAADRLGRRWIGIDVAVHAVKVIEARMQRAGRDDFAVEGMPKDFVSAERLARDDKYQFQWWANYLLNPHALREQKKGADRGIDGELYFPNGPGRPWGRMLTSVKGGANVGPAMVRDFRGVLERESAEMGIFICLHRPTKAMASEAAAAGLASTAQKGLPRLQILALEDWFEGRRPKLPPLEHLPSAAVSAEPRRAGRKGKRPDPTAPELPFSFVGGKPGKGVEVHLNPAVVDLVSEAV